LLLDLQILLRTIPHVLLAEGPIETRNRRSRFCVEIETGPGFSGAAGQGCALMGCPQGF
jgi:hypothetical protein